MLCDSVVVVALAVVCTRPQAMPLAMITMRKSTPGFPFLSYNIYDYRALLGSPLGRWSSAIMTHQNLCLGK